MSLVSVQCPHCDTRYQLQPELLGKRMRCPSPLCREIFVVQEEGRAAAPPLEEAPPRPAVQPARPAQVSGTVGELVPILPAAPATEPEAEPAPAAETVPDSIAVPTAKAPVWLQPPPVRRSRPAAETQPLPVLQSPVPESKPAAPAAAPAPPATTEPEPPAAPADAETDEPASDEPTEVAAGQWDAPPVRESLLDEETAGLESYGFFEETTEVASADQPAPRRGARRRNLLLVTILFGMIAGTVGLGYWFAQGQRSDVEEQRDQAAGKAYQDGQFAEAARLYHDLELDFPDSSQRPTYNFMSQLAALREPLHATQTDPEELLHALKDFLIFVRDEAGNPLLDQHRGDAWETLTRAADDLTGFAASSVKKDARTADELVTAAQDVLKAAAKYQPANDFGAQTKLSHAHTAVLKIKGDLAAWLHRQELLNVLVLMSKQPLGNVVERSQVLVQKYAQTQAGLATDAEVLALLKKMPALHRAGIKYTPRAVAAQPAPAPAAHLSLYLTEPSHKGKTGVAPDQPPVLALAKGVLYALDPLHGKVRWLLRLGPDTPSLPLWLPAGPVTPERLLVLAADRQALLAVEAATGTILWQQALAAPCLGQPVLLGTRAFVAEVEGRVEEIDMATGKLVGFFEVGQPLTGWGTRQPGTALLYFPADSYCVYVLDADRHECAHVLYSKHPGNALRGQPIVATQPGTSGTGLLLLAQADGPKKMKLRSFTLPLSDGEQAEALAAKELPGWNWFSPYQTPAQLALVTDAGSFAAYGLKQPLSHDADLFNLFKEKLPGFKHMLLPPRAQLVYADGNQYWLLANGKLFRLEAGLLREVGPKLQTPWEALLPPLGSPQQAAQTRQTQNGETAMYLLTDSGKSHRLLFSALETPLGAIRWQQQMGFAEMYSLVSYGDETLAVDQTGMVQVFDPKRVEPTHPGNWLDVATLVSKKLPAKGPPLQLFLRPEINAAYLLSGNSVKLQLRQIDTGKEWDIPLPAPLAGTAALSANALVLPLANGNLLRVALTGGIKTSLLNWRSEQADADAPGHVLWLGGDEFLATDGSKGVRLIHWSAGQPEQAKDVLLLDSRIARPPVLLPGANGKPPAVVLADADNGITVVKTNPLQLQRHWPAQGVITAGPFVRAGGIGCILDQQQLIWLNAAKTQPIWKYTAAAPIVGEPQLVDKFLLAADLSGRIVQLDAQTGTPKGEGVMLPGSAVPAIAPLRWTADRVIAPLTDGTIMLLKIE